MKTSELCSSLSPLANINTISASSPSSSPRSSPATNSKYPHDVSVSTLPPLQSSPFNERPAENENFSNLPTIQVSQLPVREPSPNVSLTKTLSDNSQQQQLAAPERLCRRSTSLIQITAEENNSAGGESSDSEDSISLPVAGKKKALEQSQQQVSSRSFSNTDFTTTAPVSTSSGSSAANTSAAAASQRGKDITVLLPFNHQVGGHTQLMLLNQSTLCKPLVQRELLFYLNIPHELIGFVPNYKGVVEVRHNESHNPILYHPIKQQVGGSNSSPSSPCMRKKPELRVQLCTCNDRRLLQKEFSIQSNNPPSTTTLSSTQPTNSGGTSPSTTINYSTRPSQRYFMLLENIASYYHLPCVLDLKMGTQQHGIDASDEKRRRQMAKCATTTSAKLGVRLCGMQVFQKASSNNNYRMYSVDKYYGRKINNEQGLKAELEIFFKNRFFQITPIIKKLKELRKRVIEVQRTRPLRFYSTSLLVVAEGCSASHHSRHAAPKESNSDGEEDEDEFEYDDDNDFAATDEDSFDDDDDEEVIGGVSVDFDNEVDGLHDGQTSQTKNSTTNEGMISDESSNDSLLAMPMISRLQVSNGGVGGSSTDSTPSSIPPVESRYLPKVFNCTRDHRHRPCSKVNTGTDVRMIDFAHTSLSAGSSPDGFLFGLENLIRLLSDIRQGGNRRSTTATAATSSTSKRVRRSSQNDNSHHHLHHHHHHHHNLAQ